MWKKNDDWYWEGNIQEKIVIHLQNQGYDVIAVDTIKKTIGADIIAKKFDKKIVVEVKGWPSDKYSDGPKKGQLKPTQPTLQAKHWLSEAFLTIIRRKQFFLDSTLAIGLPRYQRYIDLVSDIRWAIESLKIKTFFVDSKGEVTEL